MRRRATGSIVANPVLVGAVTTLVVVVAVFLAYNANNGLPFVPSTTLKFQVANGANLLPGNEVREGGARIGLVEDMRPVRLPDGTVGAEARMKLDRVAGDIPVDSTINLRPRSVLGLKYVELTRGESERAFEDGDTLPQTQVEFPVELDDYFRIFDRPTRSAVRENLRGFGGALSARGLSLNQTIQAAPRFLRELEPVVRVLAASSTRLDRFFGELNDAARIVRPVAERYAHSFDAGADTFEAWSRRPQRLRETIRSAAPTMRTGIGSFRVQRPFLRDTAAFSRALRDAAAVMPTALPRIDDALESGIPVVKRSPEINEELRKTMGALEELTADPKTIYALRGVTRLVDILHPLVRFVGPYVTVCNYFNYAFSNLGEHITEPDPTGYSQRTLLNQFPRTRDPRDPSMGSIGARRYSNGEPVISGVPVHYHGGAYAAAVAHDGRADCESGQRGYVEKLTTYDKNPDLKIATDPHMTGTIGTTWTGRPAIPEGQTFTRLPESGPKFPPELDKP